MQVTPDARDICQRVTLGRHAALHTGAGNLKFGRGRVTPSREKVLSSARSKIQQMEGNSQLTAEPHSNGSEPGWDLVARLSDSSDFSKLCCCNPPTLSESQPFGSSATPVVLHCSPPNYPGSESQSQYVHDRSEMRHTFSHRPSSIFSPLFTASHKKKSVVSFLRCMLCCNLHVSRGDRGKNRLWPLSLT